MKLNILCISRYFKGEPFIESMAKEGHNVYLLTSKKLDQEAWPWDALEDTYFMEEGGDGKWNMEHVINGLAHIMRSTKFDRLIALDDYDVDKVAHLREHFRIPGMGETTSRHFRDKLAMRMKAKEEGLPVPEFTPLFNDEDINAFADSVPAPWLVKPRSAASAQGIKKVRSKEELWEHLHSLGEERHGHLLERFAPGEVFHVDGLVFNDILLFSRVSQYLDTPLEVSQGGGIFRSQTVKFKSDDNINLTNLNEQVVEAFGLKFGAFHSEYIKGEDGKYYFLETASRVGGANIAEMVEASAGINLWAEWAKLEAAYALGKKYKLPKIKKNHAGIVVSLSRFEQPDTSSFEDKEIWWKMKKDWHIGLIIQAKKHDKITNLLEGYAQRIANEYHASLPAQDTHYNP